MFSLLMLAAAILPAAAAVPENGRVRTAGEVLSVSLGKDTPGAAIGIVESGSTRMLEGFGYADAEKEVLVNPATAFEIGELSGLFVALSVYRLAEQGRLDPNATVDAYLPAELMEALAPEHPVTTRQLLLGTAGFEGRSFDLIYKKDSHRFDSLEQALLAEVPRQTVAPDTYAVPSAFGIALAAYVVECVAGVTYEEYAKEQILAPLGMTETLLQPTEETRPETLAVGYESMGEGSFAAGERDGRSFAGLYPATGAISTAADLEKLMRFLLYGNAAVLGDDARSALMSARFQNGIFDCSAPALSVKGGVLGTRGSTLCFGASLWLDPAAGVGAFVLTNTAHSTLLELPTTLLNAREGVTVPAEGTLLELKALCGTYAPASGEGHSFVGKYAGLSQNVRAELNDNGEMTFLGMTLRQIAPGIFADASAEGDLAVVQFLLDGEGKVSAVVTADGRVFRPAGFFERELPSKILFYVMVGLAVFFLAAGVFSLFWYIVRRGDREAPGLVYTIPLLFAALMSACALLQVFLGLKWGGQAFSSAFRALSVCTLVCSIGALGGFLLAFASSLIGRMKTSRVFRSAALFVACLLLINYWGLTIL